MKSKKDVKALVVKNNGKMLEYLREEAYSNAGTEARLKHKSKTWEKDKARENLREANEFVAAIRRGDNKRVTRFVRSGGKRMSNRQYGDALVILTNGLEGSD